MSHFCKWSNKVVTPDFRYHVASLSAVFLALGIGILIGTGSVGAKVVQQQTSLMTRLNANFAELRKETREREQTEAGLRALLPGQIKGRLRDRNVLVLQVGGASEAAEKAEEALLLAGATPVRLVLPTESWSVLSGADQATRATQLAEALVRASALSLEELRGARLVVGRLPEGFITRRVVLVGGEKSPAGNKSAETEPALRVLARTRDIALLTRLTSSSVSVVAAESYESDLLLVHLWQGERVATIDCITRTAGQLALPFALLGELGNFGMKPGADKLLPEGLTREPEPSPMPEPTP